MLNDYDLVGSYNKQLVPIIDAERSVNLFEYIDRNSKKPKVLSSTSGLVNSGIDFSVFGISGGFRAEFLFNGFTYAVIGNTVIRVLPSLQINVLGHIASTQGYVGVDANTFQVMFVDGQNGWIYDTIANTFKQITDTGFTAKPIDVCYLDGFFVVAEGDTNNFQLSSFEQGMVWSGSIPFPFTTTNGALPNQLILSSTADFATGVPVTLTLGAGGNLTPAGLAVATTYYVIQVDSTHIKLATSYTNAINNVPIVLTGDVTPIVNILNSGQLQQGAITSHPGTIVACRTLHRRLFLFSQFYTEVWENAGIGTNLPFRRNNTLLMEYGTPAIGSIAVGFDSMFFLSQTRDGLGSVMQVLGAQAIPVSNRAVDSQLSLYFQDTSIGVSDARAFLIKENALIFYRINFTNANHTFVYNISMSDPQNPKWHEEEVLNGDRHPAQTHALFMGKNYVGHYSQPILYTVDNTVSTNDGEPIRRMRIGRPFAPADYKRIRIDRFQVDALQGQVTQGVDFQFLDITTEFDNPILTENGNTLTTDDPYELDLQIFPVMFLSVSKDGGQTYGNVTQAPMGAVGERTFRTVWRKLGTVPRGQAVVFKVEFFNKINFTVLGAAWAYDILPE